MVTLVGTASTIPPEGMTIGGGSGGAADDPTRALYPLNVPTHDGLPGVGHVDVLHVPGKFAGYEYWMGYTPLPGTAREVPCVAASHDGITWVTPSAACLPVATYAEAQAIYSSSGWWSDTDLVLSPDGTKLMLFYRGTQPSVTNDYWLATSTDGLTWNKQKIVTGGALESPAVVVEPDSTFTMFAVHTGNLTIEKRTSPDGISWSERTVAPSVPSLPSPWNIWHMDVVKVAGTYHALVMGVTANSRTDPFRLFHWTSTDGMTWTGDTAPSVPLSGSRYDAQGTYRCGLQPAASGREGRFDLWLHMIDDTRDSNHTAAVARVGMIRDYKFDTAAVWDYPDPPPGVESRPLDGDSLYVTAGQMQSFGGTPTRGLVGDLPSWAMAANDTITLGVPHLPRGWHRVAVDVLVGTPTALDATQDDDPRVGFQCVLGYYRAGAAETRTASGTVAAAISPTATTLSWVLNVHDGSDSTLDVRRDGLVTYKIIRKGIPGSTVGAIPAHVVGVRFRRV